MSKKARTKNSAPRAAASAQPSALPEAENLAVELTDGANLPTGGVLVQDSLGARPQSHNVFAPLLTQPHAPQGNLGQDFKTALYLCAATKHFSFEEMVDKGSLSVLGYMLASVGFKGSTTGLTIEDYERTLQELVQEGALEYIGAGAGFVAPGFKAEREGYVSCVTNKNYVFTNSTTELRFNDDSGQYPLYSKFVVIPGDDVKVVINTFLGIAYVTAITKMRTMLTGEVSSNRQIFFRERGFSAYDVRVTKDGAPSKIGDLVVAEILARKSPNILVVRVREVVHDTGALNTFIVKAVLEHELPNVWPDAVKRSIKSIPDKVAAAERKGRVDLRQLPLVTIDGEDAKDFDDAVYCEKQGDKFHLYVAIADVSYYVRSGSAIDAEAHERTTSIYFPFYVIPMLPEELSNGICSLNPNVDRLCMVCDMVVNPNGAIETYQFYPAVMNSHARLTYTEAHQMIMTGKAIQEEHQQCVPWVKTLYELYQVLKHARDQRGVFEIESTEVHFLFDEKWEITGMEPDPRNEAHMLIEECMIAANVCAATFVKNMQYETLYRIHDRPNEQKLDKLRAILSRYGIDLGGGMKPSPMDFKKANDQIKKLDPAVQGVISLQMLRAMSKAQYSPDNIGHFGLALENYAHFTSPIRRYPDLQLHRVIKFILEKQEKRSWGKIGAQQYTHEALSALGIRCSEREIAADDAEFDVDNSLKCEYLKHFEGEVVDGTVATVSDMGVFITLNDFYIDGLISNDYIVKRNVGEQNFEVPGIKNCIFHVGDQIKVRVFKVDSLNRFITLLPVVNAKKSDKDFDFEQRKAQLLEKSDRELRPDNTSKNEFFERIADISQGKTPEDKDQITRDQRDYSLGAKLDLGAQLPKKSKAKSAATEAAPAHSPATTPHDELKARVKQAALDGKLSSESLGDDVLAEAAVAAASAKLKARDQQTALDGKLSSESLDDDALAVAAVAAATAKLKASKKAKASKQADDQLLVDTAARIDADLSADNKRTSTKSKAKVDKAEKAEKPEKAETEASKSKAKRSNAKAKQDELSLETMVESTKPAKEVKVAKPKAKTEEVKQEMPAKVEPEVPAEEAKPKKTAVKKAADKAETPAEDAKPAAKKPATKKAAAKAEPESPAEEAKPAAKKTATKKAAAKAEPEVHAEEAKPEAKKPATKKAAAKAEPEAPAEEAKPAAKKATTKKAAAKAEPEAPAEEAKPAAKKPATKKAAAKDETPAEEVKPAAKKATTKKAAAKAEPETPVEEAKPAAKKVTTKKAAAKAEPEAPAEEAKPAAKKTATKKAAAKAEPEAPAEEANPAAKKATKKAAAKAESEAPAEETKPAAKKATTKKAAAKAEPEVPAEEAKPAAKKPATKKAAAKAETPAEEAKPAVKKPATKKAAAKAETPAEETKPAAKKPATKKAAAKAESEAPAEEAKPAAKKTVAKKAPAKKAAAKAETPAEEAKPAVKKAPAKKAATKKSTASDA